MMLLSDSSYHSLNEKLFEKSIVCNVDNYLILGAWLTHIIVYHNSEKEGTQNVSTASKPSMCFLRPDLGKEKLALNFQTDKKSGEQKGTFKYQYSLENLSLAAFFFHSWLI